MKEKSMEKYASEREKKIPKKRTLNQAMTPSPVTDKPSHDPNWDLDTLMRAEEVKSNGSRYRAAKKAGKKKVKDMSKVCSR